MTQKDPRCTREASPAGVTPSKCNIVPWDVRETQNVLLGPVPWADVALRAFGFYNKLASSRSH